MGAGLGRDLALCYAREGARVVMGARRTRYLESTAAEIEAAGGECVWRSTDIRDEAQCRALAALAVDTYGRLDILCNNAFDPGVSAGSPYEWEPSGDPVTWHQIVDTDLQVWRDAVETNLIGTLQMIRAVVPQMAAQGDGRIVNVNTQSSMWIKPTHGAYASSKGALATATKTLAVELGPLGIRVNGIHPGFIMGEPVMKSITESAERAGIAVEQLLDAIAQETCLKYLPDGEQVSGPAIFFSSDLALAVTGQALPVNCGHYLP
ncbi:MAG: SDR family oxidoreductase [Acidimicrobiales bacterium]|nr:SDR family oxidoreductase [Acidimicrobiales bacterium]